MKRVLTPVCKQSKLFVPSCFRTCIDRYLQQKCNENVMSDWWWGGRLDSSRCFDCMRGDREDGRLRKHIPGPLRVGWSTTTGGSCLQPYESAPSKCFFIKLLTEDKSKRALMHASTFKSSK
jgi:hypothetical protein